MMVSFKKRFIIFYICVCFITTSFYSFYKTEKVYADALALTSISSGLLLSESASSIVPALAVAGPYALAIVATGLACGAIYKNRAQISSFVCGAYQNLKNAGISMGQDIVSVGNSVYMNAKAKTALLKYSNQVSKKGYEYLAMARGLKVPSKSVVWTKYHFNLNRNMDLAFKGYNTYNTDIVFKTSSGKVLKGSLKNVCHLKYYNYGSSYIGFLFNETLPNSYDGESVCIGFENTGSFDESIDVDQILDYAISIDPPFTGSVSYPSSSSLGAVNPTEVVGSDSLTWDNVVDRTWDDVIADGVITDTNVTEIPKDIPSEGDLNLDLPKNISLDFSPLYLNLKDKFPFSIPFDIANLFKTFSTADRVPPKFDVVFDEGLVGRASFTISFEKFDLLARLLRFFLLAIFLLGLMKITRNIIRG